MQMNSPKKKKSDTIDVTILVEKQSDAIAKESSTCSNQGQTLGEHDTMGRGREAKSAGGETWDRRG